MGTQDAPNVCSEGANYQGSCYCYKSCNCNTTESERSKELYG